jgi:chaperonin GroES
MGLSANKVPWDLLQPSPPELERHPDGLMFLIYQPIVLFLGDAMKLRPLADRVIVKRVENETKTASGIVIPDSAAEKPDQGEVLAVGPGKKNDKGEIGAMSVKVGDRVLFGKYSGQTVKVDGDELLVMKEDDLFAVVDK